MHPDLEWRIMGQRAILQLVAAFKFSIDDVGVFVIIVVVVAIVDS